jgi:D-xylulose kinase
VTDNLILAIDVGTTGCKATLFDAAGQVTATAYEEYPVVHPRPDWAEQDPRTWWRAVCNTVRQLPGRERVQAVSVTSQREGLVPVDGNGQPLSHCIIWMDKRAQDQCDAIRQRIDERTLFAITGLRLDPAFSLAKLLWMREHQPETYKAASRFLQAGDYVLAQLSGEFVTEHSIGSRTMLLDIRRRSWSQDILERFGLDDTRLPRLLEPGTPIGPLRRQAAQDLGLPPAAIVVAGGGDQQCNAVGAGAVEQGSVSVGIGTATAPSATIDAPIFDPDLRVPCCCAAIPGKWELEPPIWTTGALLRWFRDQFGREEIASAREQGRDLYDILTAEAAAAPAGSEGLIVLPYFMGAGAPHWDALARGVLFGLSLGHRREHVIRSLLEAAAYEIRLNLEAVEGLGWPVHAIYLTGGGARSRLWQGILADVTGKEVRLPATESTPSLGAAILAAVGVGWYPDVSQAAMAMTRTRERLEPDPERHALYDQYYAVYQELYRGLAPAFRRLSQIPPSIR